MSDHDHSCSRRTFMTLGALLLAEASLPSLVDAQRRLNGTVYARPEALTVIGGGSAGAWAVFLSALAGVPRVTFFEPGRVTETDAWTGPFGRHRVGMGRASAVRELVRERIPDAQVEAHDLAFDDRRHAGQLEGAVLNGVARLDARLRRRTPRYVSMADVASGNDALRATIEGHALSPLFASGRTP